MLTASAIFYYCVIPKDASENSDEYVVVTSENPCELLFLQRILKFEADIIVGHRDWKMNADKIISVVDVCRNQTYDPDGGEAFINIMESFGVKLPMFWERTMIAKMYRKYYQSFYDDYYNKLSKAKQQDPPVAIFYNAFSKTVNEYINIEKKHGNIVLKPGR